MGTQIIINDTLQITKAQGFPTELDFAKHQTQPFKLENFEGRIFEFHSKEGIRDYQAPPVRVFLVENVNDKWLYWGLCHVLETKFDMVGKITSGKFKIIKLYTPEEMKAVYGLIDCRPEKNFFSK